MLKTDFFKEQPPCPSQTGEPHLVYRMIHTCTTRNQNGMILFVAVYIDVLTFFNGEALKNTHKTNLSRIYLGIQIKSRKEHVTGTRSSSAQSQ